VRRALKVYYDGRNFFGSARQPDRRTVEGEFLESLRSLEVKVKDFKSACRTDRGVSALGNVFALNSDSKLIPGAINSTLPRDIRVLGAREVNDNFNPRYEARAKTYRYFLHDEGYSVDKMKIAAKAFLGEHSFHNFAKPENRSPQRKIKNIDVEKARDFFVFTITGESFLWQMVRRIANVLKMVGDELMPPEEIKRLLDPDHDNIIYPLPAENLLLWKIDYPFEIEHDEYSVKNLKKDILKRQIEMKRDSLINELTLEEL
jgi:tRNA pseudouridine38-40 synthase